MYYVFYGRIPSTALLVANGNLLQSSNIFCLRIVSKIVKNQNKFCLSMLRYLQNTVKIFRWLTANHIHLVLHNLGIYLWQRMKCNISIMMLSYLTTGHDSYWAIFQKKTGWLIIWNFQGRGIKEVAFGISGVFRFLP